jgi:hypothetical protein
MGSTDLHSTIADATLRPLLSLIAHQASLICISLTMAVLHMIRCLDSNAIFHLGVDRLRARTRYRRVQRRFLFLTDVPEFVAAAIVVVLTAACRGAAEDGEEFD